MAEFLSYGDVFHHQDRDYVYLASSQRQGLVFTARIISSDEVGKLVELYTRQSADPRTRGRSETNALYCFEVLTTAEFNGQAAHFRKTDDASIQISSPVGKLNRADQEKIRSRLLDSTTNVPEELREAVQAATSES